MGLWTSVWILYVSSHLQVIVDGGVSVHFIHKGPLYVALKKTLVLEAIFQKNPEDKIDIVIWERDSGSTIVRISGNEREVISVYKDTVFLKINEVIPEHFGTYKVTVIDSNGHQKHASIEVKKMEKPPVVSVVNILDCFIETNNINQWDVPQYSWMIDGVEVTNQTALLSSGTKLDITELTGNNFTCVIESSLGTSVSSYFTPKQTKELKAGCSNDGWIAFGIVTAVLIFVLGWIIIKKHVKNSII